jgi:large subunit ribosomal protein L24
MNSKKPSKKRKEFYQAPLHKKHKLLSAHLSKELRNQFRKRSLYLRKGDEVKVMRGKFKGTTGKISKINLKRLKVYIDSVKRKKVSGEEVHVPINPSKILITSPNMDDQRRKEIVERGRK